MKIVVYHEGRRKLSRLNKLVKEPFGKDECVAQLAKAAQFRKDFERNDYDIVEDDEDCEIPSDYWVPKL